MPGFLYFAEETTAPTLERVRALGLSYAFSSSPTPRQAMGKTPSGRNGWTFADCKRVAEHQIKLDLDQQVWRKIPGKEVWVGYWKDAKPKPEDLARADQLGGYRFKLADGNEWLIPVVRAFDRDSEKPVSVLPSLYDLDENGRLTRGETQESHRWLWDVTEDAWQAMVSDGDVSDQALLEVACKILSANYAVDVVELAGVLKVFSPERSPATVVALACDYLTWQEWAQSKKKRVSLSEDAGYVSSNGATDSPHVTPQLALTS